MPVEVTTRMRKILATVGALALAVGVWALLRNTSVARTVIESEPEEESSVSEPTLEAHPAASEAQPRPPAPPPGGTATDLPPSTAAPAAVPTAARPWKLGGPSRSSLFGALHVVVTEGDGRPREDVIVQVRSLGSTPAEIVYYGSTGRDGAVLAETVPAGRAMVNARVLGLDRHLTVDVVAGRTTEVSMAFPAALTVEGEVRDVVRGPLAVVSLAFDRETELGHDGITATTDRRGRYRAELAEGRWRVEVMIDYGAQPRFEVEVAGASPVVRDFTIGIVGLRGTVRDARDGRPVPEADVNLGDPFYYDGRTGPGGEFSFANVAPGGPYKLSVGADGYGHRFVSTGVVGEPPAGVPAVDVLLEPASALLLTVLDDAGAPIGGDFLLHVKPSEGSKGTGVTASLRAGERGECSYRRVLPGSYRIEIIKEGFRAVGQVVEVGAGENPLRFVLVRSQGGTETVGGASVRGVVRESRGRTVLAGVRVAAGNASFGTGLDGAYALRGLRVGPCTLVVSREGYGIRYIREFALSAKEEREFDVLLDPAATLHLRVADADGAPVVGRLTLGIAPSPGTEGTRVGAAIQTNERGEAVYRQAVPGRYYVRVTCLEPAGSGETEAELVAGDNQLSVRLDR